MLRWQSLKIKKNNNWFLDNELWQNYIYISFHKFVFKLHFYVKTANFNLILLSFYPFKKYKWRSTTKWYFNKTKKKTFPLPTPLSKPKKFAIVRWFFSLIFVQNIFRTQWFHAHHRDCLFQSPRFFLLGITIFKTLAQHSSCDY